MTPARVIVVGAGLAGLACAVELQERGFDAEVLEGSDGIGGRVRTDKQDGFLLDRGFQVLLDSYEHAARMLDFADLELARFEPGALVRKGGRFRRVSDPLRRPSHLLQTMASRLGNLRDTLRMLALRRRCRRVGGVPPTDDHGHTALEFLRDLGFSPGMIEGFFRPFLGGVLLDSGLAASASSLLFLFGRFSAGYATLPARGMGALGEQLAGRLKPGTLRTGVAVGRLRGQAITTTSGETLQADAVVVATDASAADRLLGRSRKRTFNGTTCLYYAVDSPPVEGAWLVLDGDDSGPINHLCVPSEVAPGYAPPGAALVSASVIGVPDDLSRLSDAVRSQLVSWFGPQAGGWRQLAAYCLPQALPAQPFRSYPAAGNASPDEQALVVCGDHVLHPSIEGALLSGSRAAATVAHRLGPRP